jgi:hypothetical protein
MYVGVIKVVFDPLADQGFAWRIIGLNSEPMNVEGIQSRNRDPAAPRTPDLPPKLTRVEPGRDSGQ